MNKPKLGDLLVEANLIDELQMRIALEEQKRRGTKFGSTLIQLHFIDENVLSAFLSKQLDIPCISLANIEIAEKVLNRIPRELAVRCQAIPIRCDNEKLYVAMSDPMDLDAIEALDKHTEMVIIPMIAPQSTIQESLKRYYPSDERKSEERADSAVAMFPELMREINEMDLFGRYFDRLDERLDRIEAQLNGLRDALDTLRGRSQNP